MKMAIIFVGQREYLKIILQVTPLDLGSSSAGPMINRIPEMLYTTAHYICTQTVGYCQKCRVKQIGVTQLPRWPRGLPINGILIQKTRVGCTPIDIQSLGQTQVSCGHMWPVCSVK